MAPRAGLEPATNGLTVRRSTTELPGNTGGSNRRRAILRNAPPPCQGIPIDNRQSVIEVWWVVDAARESPDAYLYVGTHLQRRN